jgi:hypothetical protein
MTTCDEFEQIILAPNHRVIRWGRRWASLILAVACAGSDHGPTSTPATPTTPPPPPVVMRVYHNPYGSVDWTNDVRLVTQLHDHVGTTHTALLAYSAAGYDVMPLMTYSGVDSMASCGCVWLQRRWPPASWFTKQFLDSLQFKFWIPGGEEVGHDHVTSAFMTTYIAVWNPAYSPTQQAWMYTSTQGALDLIGQNGGYPIVAHPWLSDSALYLGLHGYQGVEIYSAYVSYEFEAKTNPYFTPDRNAVMQANWDMLLMHNQGLVGISVNDHFGPDVQPGLYSDHVRDSGKELVIAHQTTSDALKDALQRGAAFAVRDWGHVKLQYPRITAIIVADSTITLATTDNVSWISNGAVVGSGSTFKVSTLPGTARYVRAVVTNTDGSGVFTQAFWTRPRGDANGDGVIDALDTAVCAAVQAATDSDPDHVSACAAIARGAGG